MRVTLFIGLLAALPLSAGEILPDLAHYTWNGDTSLSGKTFNRPVANGDIPLALSLDADAVGYDTLSFSVTTSGTYQLTVVPADFGFSSYLFLYQTLFDPTAPIDNVLLGESGGPSGDVTESLLTAALWADTSYIAVVTGFSDFDSGPYSGAITQVDAAAPEPGTIWLWSGGLVLLRIARNRKRQARRRVTASRTGADERT